MTRHHLDAPDALTDGAWLPDGGVQRWVPGALSTGPVDNAVSHKRSSNHADAMSLIDGCPECVLNTEPPRSSLPVDGAWRCGYLCSDCGHAWTTDWKRDR